LFQYISFQEPACADQCRRVPGIPSKRYERRRENLIEYLTAEEIEESWRSRTGRNGRPTRNDRAIAAGGVPTG